MNSLASGNLEKSSQKDGMFRIKGIMSAPVVDLEGEMISRDAYKGIIDNIERKAGKNDFLPIVIEHRRHEPLPVGYVEKAYETDEGLAFEGIIANGDGGSLQNTIQELIQQNVLRHVSIGGDVSPESGSSEMVFDPGAKKYVRNIKNAVVRELSLTGLPVNEEATFSLAKSIQTPKEGVDKLMKKFDKAYMKESLQKSLAKAIDNNDLGAVEDALKNLAVILQDQFGLDIDVAGLTSGDVAPEAAEAKDSADISEAKTGAEIATATEEVKPENISEPKPTGPKEGPDTPVEEVPVAATGGDDTEVVNEEISAVDEVPAKEAPIVEPIVEDALTETAVPAIEEETKAIGESDTTEDKLDTIINLIQTLLGDDTEEVVQEKKEVPVKENKSEEKIMTEKVTKSTEPKEVTKSLGTEELKKSNQEGGDETMEKRLICKSCGEDFAYEEEEIEKSFQFCPKCGKTLSKAIVDTKLNKVYHIESVADAEAVDHASDMAVDTAGGKPLKDSSLTGETGNVAGIEETVDMAVDTATGKPLIESSKKLQYVAKSEEGADIEKNLVSEQIREKKQGNQLKSDFNETSPYFDGNDSSVAPSRDAKIAENQINRDGFPTPYNDTDVAKKVEKSLEERLASLEKSMTTEGRKGIFNPNKVMEKSIDKEVGENQVFLRSIFPKK